MSQKIEEGQVLLQSYDDFESFYNQGNLYDWVSVQNLLEVLKQENKFLSKDEFIDLVSKEKLRMGNPYYFDFIENINGRTGRWYESQHMQPLIRQERKKYYGYVKQCLFGDPEGTIRGLMDINVLTNNDLKEIVNLICSDLTEEEEESFFLRVRGVGVIDTNDIFCPKNKEKLANDLIKSFNKQNTNNDKEKLIAGIILLLLGVILFVVTLIIGLKSILTILLFLSSLIMVTIGVTCLFWGKINECLSSCCLPIRSNTVDKSPGHTNNGKEKPNSINSKKQSEL